MPNWILNARNEGGRIVIGYLMKQKDCIVTGVTGYESAMWMLTNDKSKAPRMSDEFEGYPLTADGIYFFDGQMEESPTDAELGADGLPIPAGDGKPKRRQKKNVQEG